MKVEATEVPAGIELDAGTYTATVNQVTESDGQYGAQCKFIFGIEGETTEDGEELQLWAWASAKLNPKTKLWKWITAVTGEPPIVGEDYDLDRMLGKQARLLVGEVEAEDGTTRTRVLDVMAKKKPMARAATAKGHCSECKEPVSYFEADGTPFCENHGPMAGQPLTPEDLPFE